MAKETRPVPARLRDKKLYNRYEFEQMKSDGNRIGRLRAALADSRVRQLDDRELAHLDKVKRVYGLIIGELSTHNHVNIVANTLEIDKGRARKLLTDTYELFGDLVKVNRSILREIYVHRVSKHIDLLEAEDPGNKLIGQLYKLLKEAQGLDYTEATKRWDEWEMPEIIFSDDPNDFAEDIDHVEIPPDHGEA